LQETSLDKEQWSFLNFFIFIENNTVERIYMPKKRRRRNNIDKGVEKMRKLTTEYLEGVLTNSRPYSSQVRWQTIFQN
jgi:nitrogenase subunit NifH